MMKDSILQKIRGQVLLGSFIAAAAVCLAAVLCIVIMRGNVIGASVQLGASAADDSKRALEHQMQESLLQLARNKSDIADEKLAAVSRLVTTISENVAAIISNPNVFRPFPISFPSATNEGITVSQLRLPEGVTRAALNEDIGLLAHISPVLISLHDSLEHVRSVYIGSERGVSISADGDSHMKTNIFDPRTRGWYISARDTGGLIWTEVFADATGRGLAITCAKPFYGPDGSFSGVSGAGMVLDTLGEIVMATTLGETGYAFISNQRGEMIISALVTIEAGVIQGPNINDLLPAETAARLLNGGEGIERVNISGVDSFIAFSALNTLPWSLAVVMSVEEVIAPATLSEQNIITMTNYAVTGIDRMIRVALFVFAVALMLTLAGNALLARRMAAGLAKPIIELNAGAEIIGAGNLDYRLDVKTGDEIEALADSFNSMIDNIKIITAEKERIGTELNVATKIQASMLPSIFPAFPERPEFDIHATMIPAKEVGGDFYDFFLVDQNKLAVVIADVSDKGVPAALFMVITKTLIKNNAQNGKSPQEVFEIVNNILCENNDADMFVTAFMGILDIPTGRFTYVNAGHNPPLIKRAGGNYEWLPTKPGFVLAGMEDMVFVQNEISLNPGDTLYMYTDGVTEARNNQNKLFTDPKLLEVANKFGHCKPKEFIESVKLEIDNFIEGAEQADDITMLIMKITEDTK